MTRVIRETLHHGNFYKVTDTPLAEGYIPTSEDVKRALDASPYAYGLGMTSVTLNELTRALDGEGKMGRGWSWFELVDVPDPVTIVRAVCACGYASDDPEECLSWNEIGEHYGQEDTPAHTVSVWTLSNGRVNIADNRTEGQK